MVKQYVYTVLINLKKSEQELWDSLDKNIRTDIRKALKQEVIVEESRASDEHCYRIYKEMCDRYYTNITYNFEFGDEGIMLVAKWKGAVIGFLFAKKTNLDIENCLELKFSATNFALRQLEASSLLYWCMILEAKLEGYEYLDFGVSDYATHDLQLNRLRTYKEKWNGLRFIRVRELPLWRMLWERYGRRFETLKKLKFKIIKLRNKIVDKNKEGRFKDV
jgi:lipid II:glycine glycyltransferase (peptidoglycan interpeptide bridge formation enzyme)